MSVGAHTCVSLQSDLEETKRKLGSSEDEVKRLLHKKTERRLSRVNACARARAHTHTHNFHS